MGLFAILLRLFPRAFRDAFGGEMREVFEAQLRAARLSGRRTVARLWFRTIAGMAAAAWHERRMPRERRRGPQWRQSLAGDARQAVRVFASAPLFAGVVIATVAIGVGGVATIFSALNAIVLRPLPATTEGERLVGIDRRTADASEGVSASYSLYRHVAGHARSLDGTAAWARVALTIARGGHGFAATGNIVSGNYFSVLGVRPATGRFFLPDEDQTPLAHPAVVVSHAFWREQLGGDDSVIGSLVSVNGREYRLVGVAPPGFRGVFTPIKIDAWVPLAAQPHVSPSRDLRETPWLWMFGRLRSGMTAEAARAELSSLTAQWVRSSGEPPAFRGYTSVRLTPLTGLPDDARRALLGFGTLLLGASLLVMLIAGANLSSLLAARALSRRREISVRAALGATRGRLVRQLAAETMLLFLLGGGGGTLLASVATAALERLPLPADGALSLELSPDWRVLALSLTAAILAGAIFGAAPALRGASLTPATLLRSTSATAGRRTLASNVLIVGQVACTLVLLTAAGLFVRSLAAGAAMDLRLDPRGVVVAAFDTEAYGYDERQGRAFYETLRRRLEAAPGVERASFGTVTPLTFSGPGAVATVEGVTATPARQMPVLYAAVAPGYLDVLRIPIVSGRDFTTADAASSAAALVNETFATRAWAGDAIGRTFTMDDRRFTVVGVVRDSKYVQLDEPARAFVYVPLAHQRQSALTLFVRGRGDAPPPAGVVEAETLAIDSRLPRPIISTIAHEMDVVLLPQRVAAIVTGVLGGLGLLLAAVGLYGLVAYAVRQRTREIGVRIALGAGAGSTVRLVLRGGLALIAAGALIGIPASIAAGRLLEQYLLQISPMDPMAMGAAVAGLTAVTLAAAYVPARRAARISPLEAMRDA